MCCTRVEYSVLSIAVIKRYSEHLWSPGNKKKIKPKDITEVSEGKVNNSEASSTSEPGSSSDEVYICRHKPKSKAHWL